MVSGKNWHLEIDGPDPNLDPKLAGYMILIFLSFILCL